MAFDTNLPGFGTNSYFDVQWAERNAMTGPRFRVANSTALQPSVNTGVARTITVGAGVAECCGVLANNGAPIDVAFAANTGGTDRYDYLVARWDWSAKTVAPAVIQGGTLLPAINASTTTPDPVKVNRIPGVQYDALICYARVRPGAGVFQPADLPSDLRVWGGGSGPVVTRTSIVGLLDLNHGGQAQVVPSGDGPHRDLQRVENIISIPTMGSRPTGANRWVGQRVSPQSQPTLVCVWTGRWWVQEGLPDNAGLNGAPDGAYIFRQENTAVVTPNEFGAFDIPLTYPATTLWSYMLPGDEPNNPLAIRPIPRLHSPTSLHAQAFTISGQLAAQGQIIRVNWVQVGWSN